MPKRDVEVPTGYRIYARCHPCSRILRRAPERVAAQRRQARKYQARASRVESVPAGPFFEWLDRWNAQHGNIEQLAARAGSSARVLYRARKVGQITFGLVDRILIADGGNTMLWELYPD